jgi:glucose/arabinose dehydrogenase
MRSPSTVVLVAAAMFLPAALPAQQTITGQAAFADWNQQQPGVRRKITLAELPQPKPDEAVNNTPHVIPRPADAWPIAPAGFKVTLYAGGDSKPMQRADNKQVMALSGGTFTMPRLIRTAPNGDLFLADSGAGTIFILRGAGPDGKVAQIEKFATGLDHPFGIAFYPADNPKYVYVGNATTIQRIPYRPGELHATAAPETIVPDIPGYAQLMGGGHWTRERGLHQRRAAHARLGGFRLQCGRPRYPPEGIPPRRRSRIYARRQVY